MAKILLADNNAVALREYSDFLRREGHEVIEAGSVSAAAAFLKRGGLDLAILDLHMERDEDESDESGLELAHQYHESVPIILITGLPTIDAALAALHRDGKTSPARAFIRKQKDGPKALLKAMQEAIVPKAFLCHGRDLVTAAEVESFLEDGGVQVVILRDKPDAGQTIIEKFERNSNVNYAIVLLTPDDVGALRADTESAHGDFEALAGTLHHRARQNVIFELGFFLAKLERSRVVTLYRRDHGIPIELPSNYDGVQKIDMNDPVRPWRIELAREMSDAGIKLDLEKALLKK